MIKAAVIGLGNMGQHHAKAYARLDNVALVAACDSKIDRFNHIIKEADTKYYASFEEMLSTEDIDVVSICVPTMAHFDVAKACMDAGLAVLVEKPIAETVEQAKALVAYAKEKECLLTVGHIERFNPAVLNVKKLLDDGGLGDIHSIICKRYGPFPKQIKDADVLVDVAVHDIDIVQFLVNKKPLSTEVKTKQIHCSDRADFGHLSMEFDGNISVNIFVSWALPYKERIIEIIGSKGVAIVDCIKQSVSVAPVNIDIGSDYVSLPVSEMVSLEFEKKEPIIEECRAFVAAFQTKSQPAICPEQATEALSLALSAN